jgi:uncharacterized protein (TIGR02996 family)
LLRAVIEHPEDDARRLVYADFLQQRGDPQGELIAVQCRLASLAADAPGRGDLETRAKALLDEHAATWTAQLGDAITRVTYHRGLACVAQAPVREGMLELLDRAPIRDLGFTAGDGDHDDDHEDGSPPRRLAIAQDLARDPRLARVELLATGVRWGEQAFSALLASTHLGRLRGLRVADEDCQVYAGHAIAAAHLPSLEVLALCGDYEGELGDVGVAALARARLPMLRDLALLNLGCGEGAARSLAESTTITGLQGLDFGWGSYTPNRIGPGGAEHLAGSPNLAGLRRLTLDFNGIGDPGLAALARSSHLGALRTLSLKDNGLTDEGLRALASAPGMPELELLELTFNRGLTHAGVEALAGSPRLATLSSLWLRQMPLGPDAARAIARSPYARSLRSLNLLECKLGDDGVRALVESPHLDGLAELQLNGNQLSSDVRTAARARWGSRVSIDR